MIGSTRLARCAGTRLAITAVNESATDTTARVITSRGPTPMSSVDICGISRSAPPRPDRDSDPGERNPVSQNHPPHVGWSRAERHANTDFTRPLAHRIGHDGVKSNRCQEHRERTERSQQSPASR